MQITFNKQEFVNNILTPVSKVADNLLIDFQCVDEQWRAKTLVNSSDNSVVLLGNIPCAVNEPFKCVIPDCKTFLRLFSGIDQQEIILHIESNVIKFKNSTFSFKYHLLDESYIVNKKTISEEKISQLQFDTSFILTKQKLSEIIKYNSIVPEAEKLYFFTDQNKIQAKLGDETKTNTNEIVTEISPSFKGKHLSDTFPLNIQSILMFSFDINDIQVHINHHYKIFKFESPCLSYVVSGLVK